MVNSFIENMKNKGMSKSRKVCTAVTQDRRKLRSWQVQKSSQLEISMEDREVTWRRS